MKRRIFECSRGFFASTLALALSGVAALAAPDEANGAILVEDKSDSRSVSRGVKTAEDGFGFRKVRRVGIGASAAGPLGLGGINLELNFSPETSLLAGYGGGPGYQSYTVQVKRVLGGESILPYLAGGYSRWWNHAEPGQSISSTTPNLLHEKFLTDRQKREGRFSKDLLYPGAGLQYVQLSGPWAGSSVFLEVLMLVDISQFVAAPTGTFGYLYYF